MAFKRTDFKKTTRKVGEGRQLYPYQIRDDRYTAAIGYALAYYERMVGRRQAEFEADALLEFFGDPRLARGLVACLGHSYAWRERTFADLFGESTAKQLRAVGLATPADFRARLYGLANGRFGGIILPQERSAALEFLCTHLAGDSDTADPQPLLSPEQYERALTLDSDGERLLHKIGPTPAAQEIVARYNFHSLETALVHAEWLQLELHGPVWVILRSAHNLARQYRLRYELDPPPGSLFDERLTLRLHGGRDAFGSWARVGRRLARAALRLLAAHPGGAHSGMARVHFGSQSLVLRLDERTLRALGAEAGATAWPGDAWEVDAADTLQRAWSRMLAHGRAAGWRLQRDPQPLAANGALVVPDFTAVRGAAQTAICLASGRATAEALLEQLQHFDPQVSAIVLAHTSALAGKTREGKSGAKRNPTPSGATVAVIGYDTAPAETIPALIGELERRHPRGQRAAPTPWQALEQRLAEEGFVSEADAAAILACPPAEALRLMARWVGTAFHVIPGVGVCSNETIAEIRRVLEDERPRQRAA